MIEQRSDVKPVQLAHVFVPLDGSEDAARARPIAAALAARLASDVTYVAVSGVGGDRAPLQRAIDELAAADGAQAIVLEDDDVAAAIVSVVQQLPGHVVCMASHGRGRTAGVMGSVATDLIARAAEPMVVVGPKVADGHELRGDVVVCVDGSARSEAVLPTAAAWAAALGLGLAIVTVAEPVPEPIRPGTSHHRTHGPAGDADAYVGGLVREWRDRGIPVTGRAVYDPVSVVGGLADDLEGRATAMVAVQTRARTGMGRVVHGSVAAAIVHELCAPVLLVPPSE